MSAAKFRFVARIVDALEHAPTASVKAARTWITGSPAWLEHFSLALSVHHGVTEEPLRLESFETVFRGACDSAGWDVDLPGSPTRRFVDLVANPGDGPRRLSLKSTAARKLSERTIHISKLTEAAWIQDVRSARARRDNLLELFSEYSGSVDAIIMLRAFRRQARIPHRYQLLEIPVSVFAPLRDLPLSAFRSDAPVLPCRVGSNVLARVAMDRSDAKITVRSISVAACVTHAEWYCRDKRDRVAP